MTSNILLILNVLTVELGMRAPLLSCNYLTINMLHFFYLFYEMFFVFLTGFSDIAIY